MPAKKGQKEVDGPPGGVVTWLVRHKDGGPVVELTGTTAFEAAAKSAWPFSNVECTPKPTTSPVVLVPVERRWDQLRSPEAVYEAAMQRTALGYDVTLDDDELDPRDRAVLRLA